MAHSDVRRDHGPTGFGPPAAHVARRWARARVSPVACGGRGSSWRRRSGC